MKIFYFRVIIIALLVFLQLSFFNIIFPWFQMPLLLLCAVVAWTLAVGFPRSLWMTVPLMLFFDSVAYGTVSTFSLYAVLLAYGTSFLSRRLLIEHRGLGLGLYGLFAAFGVALYQCLSLFFLRGNAYVPGALLAYVFSSSAVEIIEFSFFLSFPLFIVVYYFLKKFETYAALVAQRKFLNVR